VRETAKRPVVPPAKQRQLDRVLSLLLESPFHRRPYRFVKTRGKAK
jgi:hypothetical protein